jgi:hypothetical protein
MTGNTMSTNNKKRTSAINTGPQHNGDKPEKVGSADILPQYISENALFDEPQHDIGTKYHYGRGWKHASRGAASWSLYHIQSSGVWYIVNEQGGWVQVIEGNTPSAAQAFNLYAEISQYQREEGGLLKAMERIRIGDGDIRSDSPEAEGQHSPV